MKFTGASTLVTAGLLASVSIGALVQGFTSAEATRRVEALLARMPGASVGSVSVDPWTGRAAISALSIEANGARVTARNVTFRTGANVFAALVSPAFAAEGSAEADDVEIDAGVAKIHIPHIEASGTELTGDDLSEIIDPKSALTPKERLEKLTASSIVVPEVKADVTAGPLTESITYNKITLSDVESGKIGDLTIDGGTVSATGPGMPGPIEGTMGAFSSKNLDLALYARIISESRTDPNEPLGVLYESATFDGLQLKSGDAFSVSVGKMTAHDIKGRPFVKSIRELQDLMPKSTGATPTPPSPEQSKALLEFVADMYSSFEIGSTEVSDISVKVNSGPNPVAFSLGRVSLSNIANARLGEVAVDGLNINANDGHVGLGSFAIRGFDFKSTLATLQGLSPADPNAMKNINPRNLIPTIDQIVFSKIDADVPDQRHQGNVDNGNRDKFSIGKIELDGSNYLLGVPTAFSAIIDNVVAELPSSDANVKQLIALGYPKIDMSAKLAIAWNEAASELLLKEITLKGAGMGGLTVKGTFGNVTKDLFTGDPAVAQAALLGSVIKEASLRLDNTGLFEKVFDFAAKASNKSADELRKEYITAASVGIPQALGDLPAAKAVATAVAKFIAQPKSLEIVAKSAEGLGAADLQLLGNPAALMSKITVTATANQ
ncbi:MAG: hypothetical protein JO163_12120 [Methylobacteriaceae bacterium]|nr:hypothetical protein [Methylobacteriaceae bacterium]MBV9703465.1 hypothetical protein [Methylobacteriaceae bacterium]